MELDISEEQRANLRAFLEEKEEIVKHGEMKDSQFESLAELGYGNGGVVMKVRHKPSRTIMARKVRVLLPCDTLITIIGNKLLVIHNLLLPVCCACLRVFGAGLWAVLL